MIVDKLKRRILESQEKDGFIYNKGVPEKILKWADYWKDDWFEVFNKLLRRMKKDGGAPDNNNEGGQVVNNLLGKNKYMAIFFTKHPQGYCIIYDFKIDPRNSY